MLQFRFHYGILTSHVFAPTQVENQQVHLRVLRVANMGL